jgi:hypothetical protein
MRQVNATLPIPQQPRYRDPNIACAGRAGADATRPSPATATTNAAPTPIE